MAAPKDLYMNTKVIRCTSLAAADDLAEGQIQTGLSVRGNLIWLLHAVEFFFTLPSSTTMQVRLAISTIPELGAMPALHDKGMVARMDLFNQFVSSGGAWMENPKALKYLPPIPLAAPNLSLYFQATADAAELRLKEFNARLLFTTAKLQQSTYLEIAEVWGW